MKIKPLSFFLDLLHIHTKTHAEQTEKTVCGEERVFTKTLLSDAISTARDTTADKRLRDRIYNYETTRRKLYVTELLSDTWQHIAFIKHPSDCLTITYGKT